MMRPRFRSVNRLRRLRVPTILSGAPSSLISSHDSWPLAPSALSTAPSVWISNEGAGVLPTVTEQVHRPVKGRTILAVNGRAHALVGPHGQSYESPVSEWRGSAGARRRPSSAAEDGKLAVPPVVGDALVPQRIHVLLGDHKVDFGVAPHVLRVGRLGQ